jgi:excisionase family DNA binding protein
VAAHLGVSVRHVRRLVFERRIPYLKWGHLLRFDPAALAKWLEGTEVHLGQPSRVSLPVRSVKPRDERRCP